MAAFISDDNLNILIDEKLAEHTEIEKLLKISIWNGLGILPDRTYVWDEYLKAFSEGANEIVEKAATLKKAIMKSQQDMNIAEQNGNTNRAIFLRDNLRIEQTSYRLVQSRKNF